MKIEIEKTFKITLHISQREACLIGLGLSLIVKDANENEDIKILADKLCDFMNGACDTNGISAEADDIHHPIHEFISVDSDKYNRDKK
jgi:hypothetical protein